MKYFKDKVSSWIEINDCLASNICQGIVIVKDKFNANYSYERIDCGENLELSRNVVVWMSCFMEPIIIGGIWMIARTWNGLKSYKVLERNIYFRLINHERHFFVYLLFFLRIYQFISNTNLYRSIEIFKIFTKIWRQILDQRLRKVYNYVDGKGGIVGWRGKCIPSSRWTRLHEPRKIPKILGERPKTMRDKSRSFPRQHHRRGWEFANREPLVCCSFCFGCV